MMAKDRYERWDSFMSALLEETNRVFGMHEEVMFGCVVKTLQVSADTGRNLCKREGDKDIC
jgi:hypothetical protein